MAERRLRIAICTSVHSADDARVTFREGRALARAFDATLYTLGTDDDGSVDAGEGRALRTVGCGSRPASRARRFFAGRALLARALRDEPDVLLVHDPELLPWVRVLAVGRVVTAYDAHEDYAVMVLTKDWLPAPLRRSISAAVDAMERSVVRRLDVLIVADHHLLDRLGRAGAPSVVVRNYPPSDLLAPGSTDLRDRGPVIAYVGGITALRGLHSMLAAFDLVRDGIPDATLLLIGAAQDAAGEALGATPGVIVAGRVSYDEIAAALGRARVGLALLANTPKYARDVPSKVYDYMSAGVPYVASDLPGIRAAVGEVGGLLVDPADTAKVAQTITRLLSDDDLSERLGRDGVAAVAATFSFDAEGRRMNDAIRSAVAARATGRPTRSEKGDR